MTQVPAERPETTHEGDGITTSFLIGFDLPEGTPLIVTIDAAPMAVVTDYNVVGSSVVFVAAPADGSAIAWRRSTPVRQNREFPTQSTMKPLSVEGALNERTRVDQDQQGQIDRALIFPIGETGQVLPRADLRPSRMLVGFDADGVALDPTLTFDGLVNEAGRLVTAEGFLLLEAKGAQEVAELGEAGALLTAASVAQIAAAAQSELTDIGAAGDAEIADVAAEGDAQLASVAQAYSARDFPDNAKALSNGVALVTIAAAGTGGTPGTYAWTTTGGGGVNASGYLTVAGGVITSVVVQERGYSYTSAPTIVIAGTPGVTGHTLTPSLAINRPVGSYWRIPVTGGFELFENVAGVATSRGTYADKATVDAAVRGLRDLQAGAPTIYLDNLSLADLTATNLTDGVALSTTITRYADRIRIAQAVASKDVAYDANLNIGDHRTRIRQVVNYILGAPTPNAVTRFGLVLDDGTTKTILYIGGASGAVVKKVVGGATTTINTLGSSVVQGDVLDVLYDIRHDTGEVLIGYSVNDGPRYWTGFSGLPTGDLAVSIFQYANLTSEHRLEIEGLPERAVATPAPNPLAGLGQLVRRSVPPGWSPVKALPADFEVYHLDGRFATSYDAVQSPLIEADRPHCAIAYVDDVDGLDTYDGGGRATAFQSLAAAQVALRYAPRALILVKPGAEFDTRTLCFGATQMEGAICAIMPWGPGRFKSSSRFPGLVWTFTGGSTWQTTLTGVTGTFVSVWDAANPNPDGDASPHSPRASSALVESTVGAGYFLTGTTLYAKTFDGRMPDADVIVFDTFRGTVGSSTPNALLYIERADIEGGNYGIFSSAPPPNYNTSTDIVLKDVVPRYNKITGVWGYTGGSTIIVGGGPVSNLTDGNSYGSFPAFGCPPHLAIEINVVGRNNGQGGADQNSTMHSGGTMIRVNGSYTGQTGQGIADVNDAWSWLLGCTVEAGSISGSAFLTGNGPDGGTMYLDTCVALGGGLDLVATTPAEIYISNFTGTGTTSGTVLSYAP